MLLLHESLLTLAALAILSMLHHRCRHARFIRLPGLAPREGAWELFVRALRSTKQGPGAEGLTGQALGALHAVALEEGHGVQDVLLRDQALHLGLPMRGVLRRQQPYDPARRKGLQDCSCCLRSVCTCDSVMCEVLPSLEVLQEVSRIWQLIGTSLH